MKDFYVYMLKCNDGSYYVGSTDNIEERLNQHLEKSEVLYTYVSHRLPFELVYCEGVASRYEALMGEKKLKGWSRKKKEALIKHGWEGVIGIWKKKNGN